MHVVLVAGTKPAGHEHPASRACAGVAIVQIAPTAIRVTIKVLNNFTIAPPRNDAVSPSSQDYLQSIIVTVTKILHHKTFSHKSVGAGDRSVPQPNRYRLRRVPMDGLRGLIVASIPRRKLNVPRSSFVQSRHVRVADRLTGSRGLVASENAPRGDRCALLTSQATAVSLRLWLSIAI